MTLTRKKSSKTSHVHSPMNRSPRKAIRPKSIRKFYAVAAGWKLGIFMSWEGNGGSKENTQRFKGNEYKGFAMLTDAVLNMTERGIQKEDIVGHLDNAEQVPLTAYKSQNGANDDTLLENVEQELVDEQTLIKAMAVEGVYIEGVKEVDTSEKEIYDVVETVCRSKEDQQTVIKAMAVEGVHIEDVKEVDTSEKEIYDVAEAVCW